MRRSARVPTPCASPKPWRSLGEIDLSLLVRVPNRPKGLRGHVVTEESWRDDCAVIHRPAQILHPQEMKLLFDSSPHVVITYLDLIGYRIPLAYPNDREFNQYRATSNLSLQGVQRVIAISESVSREVTDEFGIPQSEIDVVYLGVEAESFAERKPEDRSVLRKMKIPQRFFFSVATDFPHKNLATLVDAYKLFRIHWQDGNPPALVLAGYASSARAGYYPRLTSQPLPDGVYYLGPISSEKLRVLYQHAEAMVYPSLYEGFGLPRSKLWRAAPRSSRCPCLRSPRSAAIVPSTPMAIPHWLWLGPWSRWQVTWICGETSGPGAGQGSTRSAGKEPPGKRTTPIARPSCTRRLARSMCGTACSRPYSPGRMRCTVLRIISITQHMTRSRHSKR